MERESVSLFFGLPRALAMGRHIVCSEVAGTAELIVILDSHLHSLPLM